MHPMIFGNYIRNQEKKLNPMSTKSQLPKFFLGMVYTLVIQAILKDHSLVKLVWKVKYVEMD